MPSPNVVRNPVGSSGAAQFQAEASNVLDRPQFAAFDPNAADGPGVFGYATSTLANQGGALNPLYETEVPGRSKLSLKLRL